MYLTLRTSSLKPSPLDNLVKLLALLGGNFDSLSRIAERNNSDRLYALGQTESLGNRLGIEIADPASPETERSSGQTEMLDSYRNIDIGVVLAVAAAMPSLVVDAACDNKFRKAVRIHSRS